MPSFQTLLTNWYFSIGIMRGVFQAGSVWSCLSDWESVGLGLMSEQAMTAVSTREMDRCEARRV